MSRCTGHCCKNIVLNVQPGELQARTYDATQGAEARQIRDMLVFDYYGEYEDGAACFVYQCRNLSPNGDCAVYEARPEVCRRFGTSESPCAKAGCTLSVIA